MKLKARAKINLALNVASRRQDGYHELEMIMLPLDLSDEIEIKLSDVDQVEVIGAQIPNENTMTKAIALMKKTYQIHESFKVSVKKKIPMEAGLAGGSADAAAVMKGINQLCHLGISKEELALLSVGIGADVPFCIMSEAAVVTGIGEQIEVIDCNCDFMLLLVKPKQGVSTPQAFKTLHLNECKHPNISLIRDALQEDDYQAIIKEASNSLEESALRLVPEIQEIKDELIQLGFDFALMSGSGSCVFGITRDESVIQNALRKLNYPFVEQVSVNCETTEM